MANMYANAQIPTYLSQGQQDLLMAALQSNQVPSSGFDTINPSSTSLDPAMLSTAQNDGLFEELEFESFSDPQLFSAPRYDAELAQLENSIENGLAAAEANVDETDHAGDKRKSMAEVSPDEDELDPKRREGGEEKQAKKPGRKPLMNEPTTKRKAQNRAAQRAFRERKEKHLHDLEEKVAELEQSSESTSHENGLLRAQVNSLQSELREYRKRLSMQSGMSTSPQSSSFQSFSSSAAVPPNQFAFDFAQMPYVPYGPVFPNAMIQQSPKSTLVHEPSFDPYGSRHVSASGVSPTSNLVTTPGSADGSVSHHGSISQSLFNGSASPQTELPQQQNIRSASADTPSSYNIFTGGQRTESPKPTNSTSNNSTTNDTPHVPHRVFQFNSGSSASPSAASVSQYGSNGLSSSAGTSPESTAGSSKEAQTTEGMSSILPPTAASASGFDAFASASNPFTVFGGSQDLLSATWPAIPESNTALQGDGAFTGGFLNDVPSLLDMQSPMNWNDLTGSMRTGLTPMAQKANPFEAPEVLPPVKEEGVQIADKDLMNCNKVWEAIRKRPDFDELDMDNLCSELRRKAKCSETGVVIDKEAVDKALKRLPGM